MISLYFSFGSNYVIRRNDASENSPDSERIPVNSFVAASLVDFVLKQAQAATFFDCSLYLWLIYQNERHVISSCLDEMGLVGGEGAQ